MAANITSPISFVIVVRHQGDTKPELCEIIWLVINIDKINEKYTYLHYQCKNMLHTLTELNRRRAEDKSADIGYCRNRVIKGFEIKSQNGQLANKTRDWRHFRVTARSVPARGVLAVG
ncbi:hypothetical protein [Candidatus Sodalis sp. SoCistrobi]|uniref:hypothetical protein n=1 Tax=Candidatus Sodalis sp. SoCistrobi TaxID=1922216 RepID=UPI000F7B091A|nr:hypothetical protein [Candidatus Sodalis sp. SoCistrobi]